MSRVFSLVGSTGITVLFTFSLCIKCVIIFDLYSSCDAISSKSTQHVNAKNPQWIFYCAKIFIVVLVTNCVVYRMPLGMHKCISDQMTQCAIKFLKCSLANLQHNMLQLWKKKILLLTPLCDEILAKMLLHATT